MKGRQAGRVGWQQCGSLSPRQTLPRRQQGANELFRQGLVYANCILQREWRWEDGTAGRSEWQRHDLGTTSRLEDDDLKKGTGQWRHRRRKGVEKGPEVEGPGG